LYLSQSKTNATLKGKAIKVTYDGLIFGQGNLKSQ